MHRTRPLPLLGILALAAALTGCSISVVDSANPSASPESSASVTQEGEHRTDPPKPAPQTDPPVSLRDGPTRDTLIATATTIQRCDGQLTLMQDAMTVRVEGACDRLILNAHGAQVVADDVAVVEIIGDSNVVFAGSIQKLNVNGSANVVTWTGATPTVSDIGSGNTLTAG